MEFNKQNPEDEVSSRDFLEDEQLDELDFEEESAVSADDGDNLADEQPTIEPGDLIAKKAKAQNTNRFSLKARRAIEDHLEQRRLRKELDYLFDDDFANENPDGTS